MKKELNVDQLLETQIEYMEEIVSLIRDEIESENKKITRSYDDNSVFVMVEGPGDTSMGISVGYLDPADLSVRAYGIVTRSISECVTIYSHQMNKSVKDMIDHAIALDFALNPSIKAARDIALKVVSE